MVSNRDKRTNRIGVATMKKCVCQFTCSFVRVVGRPPTEVGVVEFDAEGYSDGSRAVGAHGETMVTARSEGLFLERYATVMGAVEAGVWLAWKGANSVALDSQGAITRISCRNYKAMQCSGWLMDWGFLDGFCIFSIYCLVSTYGACGTVLLKYRISL